MSGSEESNETLVSGRVNYAEDHTRFWAHKPDSGDYFGSAVFIAEPALSPSDESDQANFQPSTSIDGIVGVGHTTALGPANLGTGVIGLGGPMGATGVQGFGGGLTPGGEGGVGVHGVGGSRRTAASTTPPGPGVVGQGGAQPADAVGTAAHASGVVALGAGKAMPSLAATRSAGLYAAGADVNPKTTIQAGMTTYEGVRFPGPGVIGHGGRTSEREHAPGVLGVDGNTSLPAFAEIHDTGVVGIGGTGVKGRGQVVGMHGEAQSLGATGVSTGGFDPLGGEISGIGVLGRAEGSGRGGMFASAKSAQLRLPPRILSVEFPKSQPITPESVPIEAVKRAGILPADGLIGDLFMLHNHVSTTMWVCVAEQPTVKWAQVLLGPEADPS